jgi:alkylation response protein AidB-like acyl-CoA dehydrogenase
MNFGFNDEQSEIKSTARQFLADRFKPEVVRELAEEGRYDDGLWKQICELGWTGIAIGPDHGGQGLGMVELVILCEELGYACAPTPFLANACAGISLELAGSDQQRDERLPGIASGEARGAVGDDAVFIDADGAATLIHFGSHGSRPAGATLIDGEGAELERLELIDPTRRYARLASSDGEPLEGDLDAASNRMLIAVAAELVGIAQRALDMAVAYAKERHQFERPIGAYQAVSHACATMLYDVEEARSLAYYAAWVADAEPESLPLVAAMAKGRASDAAWSVTKASLQVHGGIGFTWEHDLHFLLKRARAAGQLFGTASQHRDRVAGLAGMV